MPQSPRLAPGGVWLSHLTADFVNELPESERSLPPQPGQMAPLADDDKNTIAIAAAGVLGSLSSTPGYVVEKQ